MRTINSPLPSISADIDSKSKASDRQRNPKNVIVDLQNPMNWLIWPPNHQRWSSAFPIPPRKSSSIRPDP